MSKHRSEARQRRFRERARKEALASGQSACLLCGVPLGWGTWQYDNSPVADHIIPLSRGGTYAPENAQIICRKCNQRKNESLPQHVVKEVESVRFSHDFVKNCRK